MTEFVETSTLHISYLKSGSLTGWPVVLLHGFPYDIHAYDEVAQQLAAAGACVYVPCLRGYGSTRFLREDTLRSGQQAALGHDLKEFIERLDLRRPLVGGYDWGGRAACVVAACWPALVSGLISCNGYNIQDIATAMTPVAPSQEQRLWYQYYFHSERGRNGLRDNRQAICRLLWQLWSPSWAFDDATFEASAASFENPDFVEVVIHSYRHRFGLVAGDPSLDAIERQLARQPTITLPSITLDGMTDGVAGGSSARHATQFTGRHQHLMIEGAGHNLPQEAPAAFAAAVIKCHAWSAS